MKKLLLHICCGPCASPVIPNLNFKVTGFYYNPNIYPETELTSRLESAKKVASFNGIEFIESEQSTLEFSDYIKETKAKPERCFLCYKLRLTKTAEYAKENNFQFFSTTLLISPYQYHEEMKKIGEEVGTKNGVEFYYSDFRHLYNESRQLARELDLYIQKYCGCKFSRKRK